MESPAGGNTPFARDAASQIPRTPEKGEHWELIAGWLRQPSQPLRLARWPLDS